MKKALYFKLIVNILMLVLVVFLAIRFLGGGLWNINGWSNMRWGNIATGQYELKIQKEFDNIDDINIELVFSDIELIESNDGKVRVEVYSNDKENKYLPTVNAYDNRLEIKSVKKNFVSNLFIGNVKEGVKVYASKDIIQKLRIDTVSSDVVVSINITDSTINTVSGNIQFYGSGVNLNVDSVSGEVKVYQPFDLIDVGTVSGNLKAMSKENSTIRFDSTSGELKVELCDLCGYDVDFNTVSGDLEDKYNHKEYEKSGRYQEGNRSIKVNYNSISGDMTWTNWN